MVRAIILLSLISLPSFAGDNSATIITKGTNNQITTKQIGNSNTVKVICGAQSGGTAHSTYTYASHTCGGAVISSTQRGNSNIGRIYTVWSNNVGNTYTIDTDGNDNFAWIDQDQDDNVSTITQDGNSNYAEHLGSGNDNAITITQTGDNMYAKILTFSDDSDYTITQSGSGAHNAYIYNYGNADNNSATVTQYGVGNKDADIFFYADADNSTANLTQYGSGAHAANMKFYTDDYTVNVTQSGATNQAYTAVFNCVESCTKTLTITQQ
jgi:hypothetical protein